MKYRDITPLNIRFPAELKLQLDKSAEKNHRSMNAEVVTVMESYYGAKSAMAATLREATDDELLDELIRRFGREAFIIQVTKKET